MGIVHRATNFVLPAAELNRPLIGWHDLISDPDTTVADADAPSGGPRANATDFLTYDFWQVQSGGTRIFETDLGSPKTADYAGIAAHTLGDGDRTVAVEWSDDGSGWTNALDGTSEAVSPTDNGPILIEFASAQHRWWRFVLGGSSEAAVGVLVLGRMLRAPHNIYGGHSPAPLARATEIRPQQSVEGQFLGRSVGRQGLATDVALERLPAEWYRQNFDPFVASARRRAFFWAWRPGKFPAETAYVWTTRDIVPANSGTRDFLSVSFGIEGIAE